MDLENDLVDDLIDNGPLVMYLENGHAFINNSKIYELAANGTSKNVIGHTRIWHSKIYGLTNITFVWTNITNTSEFGDNDVLTNAIISGNVSFPCPGGCSKCYTPRTGTNMTNITRYFPIRVVHKEDPTEPYSNKCIQIYDPYNKPVERTCTDGDGWMIMKCPFVGLRPVGGGDDTCVVMGCTFKIIGDCTDGVCSGS